jgi:Flp pilus assembly secretin CpaC
MQVARKQLGINTILAAVSIAASLRAQQPLVITPNRQPLTIIKSQHARISTPVDIQRIAVGDSEIMSAEPIGSRELLLLGKGAGRTTLVVWLRGGNIWEYIVTVQRDLSVLTAALKKVYPGIEVEIAPDRDAVILTGTVPNVTFSETAERVAQEYLDAGQPQQGRPLIGAVPEPAPQAPPPQLSQPSQAPTATPPPTISLPGGTTASVAPTTRVINLLRLEQLPLFMEEKIRQAIQPISGNVTVRRILRGPIRNDAQDVFLLEGSVPNQVALVRIMSLASDILVGHTATSEDITVVADEAGALANRNLDNLQSSLFTGFGGGSSSIFGGQGGSTNLRLNNQIRKNLARAKVLEAASGRLLSFIQVADLPQVRVNIRLYEVNRTKLRNYSPNFGIFASDFKQPSFNPAAAAQILQNDAAVRVGAGANTAFQNVVSFLGGIAMEQLQLTSGHFAIDAALSYLESVGIARSLSAPSLTVLSGELALFQVGGQVPIPEAFSPAFTGTANQAVTPGVFNSVFFQAFGVQLDIRPLVGEDDSITLDVLPQVATPDPNLTNEIRATSGTNLQTTAFSTRSLRTSARLQDGQALLIGGLLTRNTGDNQNSTPGLRDIPGLGWLFSDFRKNDDSLELVVEVNPVVLRDPVQNVSLWEFPSLDEAMERRLQKPGGAVP